MSPFFSPILRVNNLPTKVKHFLITTKKSPCFVLENFAPMVIVLPSDGNKLSSEDKTLSTEDKTLSSEDNFTKSKNEKNKAKKNLKKAKKKFDKVKK